MRRTACLALVFALGSVSGCAGNIAAKQTGSHLLTGDEAFAALLTASDLGPGFEDSELRSGGAFESLGCLGYIDQFSDAISPEQEAEAVYVATASKAPATTISVGSFERMSSAETIMSRVRYTLTGCTTVDARTETRGDGRIRVTLDLETDEDELSPGVDDEINVDATGRARSPSGEVSPLSIRLSLIRVDNHIALVGFLTPLPKLPGDAEAIVRAEAARLVAVSEGKRPPPADLDVEPVDEGTGTSEAA